MTIINSYINGNVKVQIFDDGTKIREYQKIPKVNFPESIDIKITNYCDMGCAYCHENSNTQGKHGNLDFLLTILKELPAGVELAIGGGNPLAHPDLVDFLKTLKVKGIIANITVNQGHVDRYKGLIKYLIFEDLIKGVGISIINKNLTPLKWLHQISENIVYHIIAGINMPSIIDEIIKITNNPKILILGYKTFGRGIKFYNPNIEENIKQWYRSTSNYIGKVILSFDNLAIEQLKIKRLFTDEGWDMFYMGDDFQFSMYIDAVKQEYAPTSRSFIRQNFKNYNLIKYFKQFKNN